MILITGGTGFIGSHIVENLLQAGKPLRLLARNPEKVPAEIRERVQIIEGDLLEGGTILSALEGVDTVIHCAAVVSFWKRRWKEMHDVNVLGTEILVDTCLTLGTLKQFIHISSIAALGRTNANETITEKSKWNPSGSNTQYAISKYNAEKTVYKGFAEGLKGVILNPGTVIGPGDWNQGTPKFFKLVDEGLKYYNEGENGFVAARDVALAIQCVLDAEICNNERYILVNQNMKYHRLLELIAQTLGKPVPSKKASRSLAILAGTLSESYAGISGNEPLITRESSRLSGGSYRYNGSKILDIPGFSYCDLEKEIIRTAEVYLEQKTSHQ